MLQPQGLFSAPRPFQPQPWPGSGGSASLFAPPLPGDAGPREGPSQTLPHGMQPGLLGLGHLAVVHQGEELAPQAHGVLVPSREDR